MGRKMETAGDVLKKERRKQKKDLQTVSLETKIDTKKLKALEENNFRVFESLVSTKGFLKIYAEYLGLDPEKILAVYRRDFGEKKQEIRLENIKKDEKKTFPWRYLYLIIPIILIFSMLIYIYYQFSSFQNPPKLEILEPQNNTTINEELLEIKGFTDHDAIVEISGSKIPVGENGEFTTNVPMKQGENTITIKSTSIRNPSRESIEIFHINYQVEEEEEKNEEDKPELEKIDLDIKVENAPTWVEIIIDDQLVVSQVLQPGDQKDFEAERNVTVKTSILQNIKVEINNEPRGLSSETFSIRCEIGEEELECK